LISTISVWMKCGNMRTGMGRQSKRTTD
jgi:hypothetical protein